MIALQVQDVKLFTSQLFVQTMFDEFLMSEMDVATAHTFHIDGTMNKEWFTSDEEEAIEGRRTAKWKEIKPIAFQMIKGNKTPLSFKIVFQLNHEQLEKLITNSGVSFTVNDVNGLFMNVKYDRNGLTVISGSSLRIFTIDKSLEQYWDATVKQFMKKFQIAVEEV